MGLIIFHLCIDLCFIPVYLIYFFCYRILCFDIGHAILPAFVQYGVDNAFQRRPAVFCHFRTLKRRRSSFFFFSIPPRGILYTIAILLKHFKFYPLLSREKEATPHL